jgi:hypothetical protein
MKTTFYFLFVFVLLLICFPLIAQESEKPFVVSPLIGDTLSLEERDYYSLLPTIKDFQFAIFYLNADSLLDVRVSYKTRNGIRDTLIIKYKSLENLRLQLLKTDIAKSRQVTAYFENNFSISGGFLSINQDSILIFSEECEDGTLNSSCFTKINNTEIKKLVIPGESNIGESIVWCTLIGTFVGSAIGYVINENTNGWEELNAAVVLASGLVGSCVGLLTGLIYGSITSEPDIVIQQFSESDIKGLSQYAIFPSGEPDELKKIK